MTKLGCLWSPFGPEARGLHDDPDRWLDERTSFDRLGVDLSPGNYSRSRQLSWAPPGLTMEAYLEATSSRPRQIAVCFQSLQPGHQGLDRGGQGYNGNVPDFNLDRFGDDVAAFKAHLGSRVSRVTFVQAGNEEDYCPAVRTRDLFDKLYQFQVERLLLLREAFPGALVVAGGMTLVETFPRQGKAEPQLNWRLAGDRRLKGLGIRFDVHKLGGSEDLEAEARAFWRAFPNSRVVMLETAWQDELAAKATKALNLEALAIFAGTFPSERWGVAGTGKPTHELAVVGRRNGRWAWNASRAAQVTAAAELLGALRNVSKPPPPPPPPEIPPDVGDDLAAIDRARRNLEKIVERAEATDTTARFKRPALRALEALDELERGADRPPIEPPPIDVVEPPDPPASSGGDEHKAAARLLLANRQVQLMRPPARKSSHHWHVLGPKTEALLDANGEPVEAKPGTYGVGPTIVAAIADYERRTGHVLEQAGNKRLSAREAELINWLRDVDNSRGGTVARRDNRGKFHGEFYRPATGAQHSGARNDLVAALEYLAASVPN